MIINERCFHSYIFKWFGRFSDAWILRSDKLSPHEEILGGAHDSYHLCNENNFVHASASNSYRHEYSEDG